MAGRLTGGLHGSLLQGWHTCSWTRHSASGDWRENSPSLQLICMGITSRMMTAAKRIAASSTNYSPMSTLYGSTRILWGGRPGIPWCDPHEMVVLQFTFPWQEANLVFDIPPYARFSAEGLYAGFADAPL
eukprot:5664423-Amphidinium_carterae.2